jgi:hypothetical protein
MFQDMGDFGQEVLRFYITIWGNFEQFGGII